MKYKKPLTWAFIILVIGGGLFLSWWFASLKPDPPRIAPPAFVRQVQTQLISYGDVTSNFEVPGRMVSGRVVEVIAEVPGEILAGAVPLKKGQSFSRGDLLYKIYDEEQILTLKSAKSRFMNLLANALADIKFDYPDSFDQMLAFFESIEIGEPVPDLPEVDDKALKIFLASRDILNQYYIIRMAEERLQKHYKHAPFNGTFMDVNLETGAIANPGSRIARIIKTDVLELEAPVEVGNVRWIKTGDPVAIYDETRTISWQGKVTRISEFVDPATQSVSVFVEINNRREMPVLAGMFLVASFNSKMIQKAMEIPRQAVFNQNEVFVVEDSALRKRQINVQKINQNTLFFNGLDEGAEIVVEPLINVREGTLVQTSQL